MKIFETGKLWPYAIAGAITMVFGFCVTTIIVTSKADIQESNAYMTYYQDADANANTLIKNRMAFDKKINIQFIAKQLQADGTTLEYKVTDKVGNAINNAKLKLLITRPETHTLDKTLEHTNVKDGMYSFENVKFPKPGIYNLIVKVEVGNLSRFYNIKADTRYKKIIEF
jgi:nitrogen fixation protein FixH